jgi:hypothetical protein
VESPSEVSLPPPLKIRHVATHLGDEAPLRSLESLESLMNEILADPDESPDALQASDEPESGGLSSQALVLSIQD